MIPIFGGLQPIFGEELIPSWISAVGQFAGILVTVILFLRYLSDRDKEIRKIVEDTVIKTEAIVHKVEQIKDDFSRQLDRSITQFVASSKDSNAELRRIIDSHFGLSRDTIQTIARLDNTMTEFKNAIASVKGELESLKTKRHTT